MPDLNKKATVPQTPEPAEQNLAVNQHKLRQIRRKLLQWFKNNGRNYPWRSTGNWQHLLLAEMMLRRTRADQVLPVYQNFLQEFPVITDAIKNQRNQKKLASLLYSLGLKWRNEALKETLTYLQNYVQRPDQTATEVRETPQRYQSTNPVPQQQNHAFSDSDIGSYRQVKDRAIFSEPATSVPSYDALKKIPGVGNYSAAMIRARLCGDRRAAIDGNWVRLFGRIAGRKFTAEDRRKKWLINIATEFVDSNKAAEINLAVLDFAALVCKPRPDCFHCLLRTDCSTGLSAGG